MLTKKVANVGFEAVATVDRRPFGIEALASYPVFPPEFVDFLRRVVPADRHDKLVWSLVVLARKPEGTGGPHAG
ncbi:MAG TPA: hypothetical protein VLG10_16765 [Methylomirabilota bacterium]|nr:hypothetical protein [Methylomirabilota bacterium]